MVALDGPSGVGADTGRVEGRAGHAGLTVTFHGDMVGVRGRAGGSHIIMLRRLLLALFALAAADVEEVSDERTFKRILADNPAVAVDFFSHTCGPCIMIAPKFKDLAREYDGKVKFIKVDVQRNYVGVQVRSMPTFHFYVQGKLEHQFSGADENGMRQSVAQIARKGGAMDIGLALGALVFVLIVWVVRAQWAAHTWCAVPPLFGGRRFRWCARVQMAKPHVSG